MKLSNRAFAGICIVGTIGVILLAGVLVNRNGSEREGQTSDDPTASLVLKQEEKRKAEAANELANRPTNRQALARALGLSENEIGRIGDVERPKRDYAFGGDPQEESDAAPRVATALPPTPQAGRAPRLSGNENPQVRKLVSEISGENPLPQAMSSYFQDEAFDRQAYLADPDAYLQKTRPGRAFAPADPGPDVIPLESLSPGFVRILQGEQVVLKVKAEPGLPVTFYSPDTGHFVGNLLTTRTIAADNEGVAQVTYKTGPGSLGLTDVMVASPVHSRQIQYRIKVELPETVANN